MRIHIIAVNHRLSTISLLSACLTETARQRDELKTTRHFVQRYLTKSILNVLVTACTFKLSGYSTVNVRPF